MSNAAVYDELAAGWADHTRRAPRWLLERDVLADLAAAPGDVLCVGCGTGAEIALLRDLGARSIDAFDASARMVAEAQDTHPDARVWQASFDNAALAAGRYDVVFAGMCLHYPTTCSPPSLG